jgi:hypothetical protein
MVTGHRPQHLPADSHDWIRGELHRIAAKLRDQHGTTCGITGMALGSDMWWANSLHRAAVPYVAHIPFPEQPDPWRGKQPDAVAEWHRLRAQAANEHVYGNLDGLTGDARKRRAVQLLHERNAGMIAASDAVIAVWQRGKRSGGTYSALVKAHQVGMPVVLVDVRSRFVTVPSPRRLSTLLHPDCSAVRPASASTQTAS